jgi:acyl-CoA synthetase (AMP-forming)/AMP-acid ligase II
MSTAASLVDLLSGSEADAVAIGATEGPPMSFGALRLQVERAIEALNGLGIGRGERVAIVMPNGPALASAFLGVAAAATACPLNPAFREEEFAFYLADLRASALLVERGSTSVAVEVARRLGIRVLEASTTGDTAGAIAIVAADGATTQTARERGPAAAADIALILHTSGTTSRPKIVPLSHANLHASARNIAATLRLTPADRHMNVMPLFHIHGLVAGLLAPLAAGSSVVCTPGFNALRFFAWMADCRPTWVTAVPTMHQAILARGQREAQRPLAGRLRLLRSSSAAMPPQAMARLEALFDAPLIEAYGMTEASHQMASNPLPPGRRKPGSVGPAAGVELAIMGEAGRLLAPGATGEIVIRGPGVTTGYENNPQANAGAFVGGWFRTGDQGVLDGDGYLSITGRLKEIINRGGEKISPREVDEVLMDHPAVAQAVTFALPHDTLGEDVGAAVVLHAGETVSERELRGFAGNRLADFKVPRRIVFLDEIPKGATGKLQRIGLAARLGLASPTGGRQGDGDGRAA